MLNVPAPWRIKPSFADLSPFGAGECGRALRIVIDADTVASGMALDLLRDFSRRSGVEVFSTDNTTVGHIELGPEDREHDILDVKYVLADDVREAALFSASSLRTHAHLMATEHGVDEEGAWRGLALAQIGRLHQIDAVVSSSEVLDTDTWRAQARKGHVMAPADACALLGLCLRAHNDFTVSVIGNGSTFVRFENFYRGAASASLPGFASWLAAAWAIRKQDGDRRPFVLLRAVEARLGRALVARDYVDVRIRHWRPDEAWDEVLYFFESLLLSLGGALDALARALDATLRLSSGHGGEVGFRKAAWRKSLVEHAPSVAELLADGSHLRAVVDMVASLRNFIHEEVLSSEVLSDGSEPDIMDYGRGLLALAPRAAEALLAAAPHAGGADVWGLESPAGDAITVMPILFQRAAIEHVLLAIRELMATNLIPSEAPKADDPFATKYWLPTAEHAPRLRLLMGLTDGRVDAL